MILHGADLTEARAHAEEIAARDGLTFIHPFDNAHVIAGQGTMALEILEQTPDVEAIVVPVGGGGLHRRHRHRRRRRCGPTCERRRRRARARRVPHRGARGRARR